jgi:hypothetical protein
VLFHTDLFRRRRAFCPQRPQEGVVISDREAAREAARDRVEPLEAGVARLTGELAAAQGATLEAERRVSAASSAAPPPLWTKAMGSRGAKGFGGAAASSPELAADLHVALKARRRRRRLEGCSPHR